MFEMKENWFVSSKGGMEPFIGIPRMIIAVIRDKNPKALEKAELKCNLDIKKLTNLYWEETKPCRTLGEKAHAFDNGLGCPNSLLLSWDKCLKLEKEIDERYQKRMKQIRDIYSSALLRIFQREMQCTI